MHEARQEPHVRNLSAPVGTRTACHICTEEVPRCDLWSEFRGRIRKGRVAGALMKEKREQTRNGWGGWTTKGHGRMEGGH